MALDIVIQLAVMLGSLAVLAAAARYVVEGASKLAKFLGISELAIGFLLISFLTSLPELSVAVVSSSGGNNNLSLGDLLGSNVTNVALILGLSATLSRSNKFDRKSIGAMLMYIFLSFIPFILIIDGQLGLADAGIMLVIYLFFLREVLSEGAPKDNGNNGIGRKEAGVQLVVLLAGMLVVIVSAGFMVENAVLIANSVGLFQSFIGATVIALGTSVPELAVNITAARKGKWGLAVGNILGSNVTNITLLLGINAAMRSFEPNLLIATPIMAFILLSSGFLGYLLWKNRRLNKDDGIKLLLMYAAYLIAVAMTQVAAH